MKNKKTITITEILILILGIISISYAIGSEIGGIAAPIAPVNSMPDIERKVLENAYYSIKLEGDALSTISVPSALSSPAALPKTAGAKEAAAQEMTKTPFFKTPAGQVINNGLVALAIGFGLKMVLSWTGLDKKTIDATSAAAGISYFASSSIKTIFGKNILGITPIPFTLGVTVVVFLATWSQSDKKKIVFSCDPWEAPTKGENCELCNSGEFPCSDYQCRSLGQACELINQGTADQACVWKSRNDVTPPIINPLASALPSSKFTYAPYNAVSTRDEGVRIRYNSGCIPAFTPFTFGIYLDEPGKCKIDSNNTKTFDEMQLFFGGSSTLKYNHTQTLSLPSKESLETENITLENGGEFNLYIRCQDANGNANVRNFVFNYCVDEGPDATPPLIVKSSLNQTTYISYNQTSAPLSLYINEPAECRYSRDMDESFETMEFFMKCSTKVFESNAQMLYPCTTTLENFESLKENKFYFRCKDNPSLPEERRNVNTQGFEINLVGTRPLVIEEAGPTETVKGSSELVSLTLTAKTMAGSNEGIATCYYSESCYDTKGSKEDFIRFYYPSGTSSYQHKQENLRVPEGNYECAIRCVDLAGNSDTKDISYSVETDTSAPQIIRAYHDSSYLRITTNEDAECVYSIQDCIYLFDDGQEIRTSDGISHLIPWDPKKTYYVKCRDEYLNEPFPDACSIIVRASESY